MHLIMAGLVAGLEGGPMRTLGAGDDATLQFVARRGQTCTWLAHGLHQSRALDHYLAPSRGRADHSHTLAGRAPGVQGGARRDRQSTSARPTAIMTSAFTVFQ